PDTVGFHRGLDPVIERLLADLWPPHLAGLRITTFGGLALAPPLPHRSERRPLCLHARRVKGSEVGLQRRNRPVPGLPAATELTTHTRRLPVGGAERELERLRGPALGDLEPSHRGRLSRVARPEQGLRPCRDSPSPRRQRCGR